MNDAIKILIIVSVYIIGVIITTLICYKLDTDDEDARYKLEIMEKKEILKHLDSMMICIGNAYDTSHYLLESDMKFIEQQEKCIKELLSDSQKEEI